MYGKVSIILILTVIVINGRIEKFINRRCNRPEAIEVPECSRNHYNFTQMPNLLGHESQLAAKLEFNTFGQLLKIPCSSFLNLLLCSVYFPMCDPKANFLMGPCKSLCLVVKNECQPLLQKLKYYWPESLDCEKMAPDSEMCISAPQIEQEEPMRQLENIISDRDMSIDTVPMDMFKHLDNQTLGRIEVWIKNERGEAVPVKDMISINESLSSCGHLSNALSYVNINLTGHCAPLCEANIFFSSESKDIAQMTSYVLTIICLITCLITIVLFIRNDRFRPCERPILYIAGCKFMYAVGFLIGHYTGRENVTCGIDYDSNMSIRLDEGLSNSNCALSFMLRYFFNTSSKIWETLLTLNWILHICGLFCYNNDGKFSITSLCCYISESQTDPNPSQNVKQKKIQEDSNMNKLLNNQHTFAWLLPGIGCIIVLVTRSVDADELIGVCGVGNLNAKSFKFLILIPDLFLRLTALLLIVYGILWMIQRLRMNFRYKTSALIFHDIDDLSIRMSLFCLFLIFPSLFIMIVNWKHYQNLVYMTQADNRIDILTRKSSVLMNTLENKQTNAEWFILKNLMEYIVGISCGIWSLLMQKKFMAMMNKSRRNTLPIMTNANNTVLEMAPSSIMTMPKPYAYSERRIDFNSSNTSDDAKTKYSSDISNYYSNDKCSTMNLNQNDSMTASYQNPVFKKSPNIHETPVKLS